MSDRTPSFWLTGEQATIVSEAIARRDGAPLPPATPIAEWTPVPACPEGVGSTLYGELLNFLLLRGLDFVHGRVGQVSLNLFSREALPVSCERLDQIVGDVKDSDFVFEEGFILYIDEPALIRSGIEYLRRGLGVPFDYDALLIVSS